ncbi:MAG: MFS transporter [Roseburia sp.]|nr:MFS transporter [Roseburia sp.]
MLMRLRSSPRRFRYSDTYFARMFNFREEHATGRSLLLLHTLFCGIGNVFITGTFYTGFLTENGIDIVNVGIITFIPYFCWIFSLFAPKILRKFKKRRTLLLFNHTFYYLCIVLATTIMPLLVRPEARIIWFAVFLILGNLSNALIGSGATAWHMHFLPEGKERNYYFSITNLVANLVGTITAIGASLVADALSGSDMKGQIIFVMRLVSAGIFLVDGVLLYLIPKEYPYEKKTRVQLKDVFITPIRDKKFILTVLIIILWNFICNLNANTWTYYLLNTVKMNYIMTYVASIVCAVCSIFMAPLWRRAISRFGWFKIVWINMLASAFIEFIFGFTTGHTKFIYIIAATIYGINIVGAQITLANVFYLNLPKKDFNFDVYITFYNLAANIAVFLGSLAGTGLLSILETSDGSARMLLGLPFYSSQFLVWVKGLLFLCMAFYIYWVTPKIQEEQS